MEGILTENHKKRKICAFACLFNTQADRRGSPNAVSCVGVSCQHKSGVLSCYHGAEVEKVTISVSIFATFSNRILQISDL